MIEPYSLMQFSRHEQITGCGDGRGVGLRVEGTVEGARPVPRGHAPVGVEPHRAKGDRIAEIADERIDIRRRDAARGRHEVLRGE